MRKSLTDFTKEFSEGAFMGLSKESSKEVSEELVEGSFEEFPQEVSKKNVQESQRQKI